MNSETVIEVRNLSKSFRLGSSRSVPLKDILLARSSRNTRSFTALHNIDLQVSRGEVVGILGKNGSGKSTLLRTVSGITYPTVGTVKTVGRLVPLLELGVGFHPDLSGRENIVTTSVLFGLSEREAHRSMDEIIEFSELQQFIDEPVRHYSTGMYARLGFAIATHMVPDILMIDEVLAVGDAGFQARCLSKMQHLNDVGVTMLVVSHNITHVQQLCHRVLILDGGSVIFDGPVGEGCRVYSSL